jgi:hypothetical protein
MAFHGIGTYNIDDSISKLSDFDLFLCPNRFFKNIISERFSTKCIDFGYPRLFTKSLRQRHEPRSIVYIPHWKNEGSFFQKVNDVIDFCRKFEVKYLLPHGFLFKNENYTDEVRGILKQLKDLGFILLEEDSVWDILSSDISIVTDIHSSTYAEALFLDKDVYYIDSCITDTLIEELKLIGRGIASLDVVKIVSDSSFSPKDLSYNYPELKGGITAALKRL